MDSKPRPPGRLRSPLAVFSLCALLLPLLSACGGSSSAGSVTVGTAPTRSPVEAVSDISSTAATTAPLVAGGASADARIEPTSAAGAEYSDLATIEASGGADDVETIPAGASEVGAPLPTQPPPEANHQEQHVSLKAGEVDDNTDFAGYNAYLASYYGSMPRVDISERYILTVLNDQQQPVLDASVRVFDGDQLVFEGRTYAGGKTILFPRALSIPESSSQLRVTIAKGNSTAEGTLTRGQDSTQSFVLSNASPAQQPTKLDVMFLLDATGSMGDEIYQIQRTILNIADRINAISPRPELRFGLVAYRDYGDDYVTRAYDFTPDVAAFQKILKSVNADGGGDEPEALNEALHAAVQGVNWADDAVRLTFLVADAPPHLNGPRDYVQEARVAVSRGVKIYPIAASNTNSEAEYVFRQLAQQTLGNFIFLTYQPGQSEGAPGETTQMNVDPSGFTVERLDDLVVQVVERELAEAVGAR